MIRSDASVQKHILQICNREREREGRYEKPTFQQLDHREKTRKSTNIVAVMLQISVFGTAKASEAA